MMKYGWRQVLLYGLTCVLVFLLGAAVARHFKGDVSCAGATHTNCFAAAPAKTASPIPLNTDSGVHPENKIDCGALIRGAHLWGQGVTPETAGRLFSQALRVHGAQAGYQINAIDMQLAARDTYSCIAAQQPRRTK